MSRKTLGYSKLEWSCPRCKSRNPGPQKTCLSCGAPQPKDVKFEKAEKQQILSDKREIEAAKKTADIHCAFCGARNPAEAAVCSQCGADLKHGTHREAGQVIGAFQDQPKKESPCPNCGVVNSIEALKCSNCGATLAKDPVPIPATESVKGGSKGNLLLFAMLGLVMVVILCVIMYGVFGNRTEQLIGTVQNATWMTSVAIEALQPTTHSGWIDEIPSEAEVGTCSPRLHHIQDEPAINSVEVCGTPYQIDQGQGFAEVVQDCQYEIYVEYCDFTVMDWQAIDTLRLQGNDYVPLLPQKQLLQNQRWGEENRSYTVEFATSEGQYIFETDNLDLYQQCQLGSQWQLNIGAFNQVVSIEAVQ